MLQKNCSLGSRALLCLILCLSSINCMAWGFWAHQQINHLAVFTLPAEMMPLYKIQIDYLTEHAVDPDKRRYAIPDEAPRHFIDLDHYCTLPCNEVPHNWSSACEKFSEDTLKAYGIVPWHIQRMLARLENAFKEHDRMKILKCSAELGHYVADAHVPLHTTQNYDGQLSGQNGIHGFWESRIPELLGADYDPIVGQAVYLAHPLEKSWQVVYQSHQALDTVLQFEKKLNASFPLDRKYGYITKGTVTTRTYSDEYTTTFNRMMGDLVERRFRASVYDVGCFWYTAWVNAGKPDLRNLKETISAEEILLEERETENLWMKGSRIFGRMHE